MLAEIGINVLGYINKQFGLGEGARCNIRAIAAAKVPFALNDFSTGIADDIVDENTTGYSISKENPYKVNLIHVNAENFANLINENALSYFSGKYNIGFWAWELENFPTHFQNYIDMLDEIWVPSNFCQNAIAQISSKPVLRFMHSIAMTSTDKPDRELFSLPKDKIVFLAMFDYHSTVHRKNPYAVIEAFEKAFQKNSTDVILVIKSSSGLNHPVESESLKRRIKNNDSIVLIDQILPREKLENLISCCDVYVSLHRSEGFGLTMAEAMYCGKPVIATAYSANTEFMSTENSLLVPFTLIPTNENYYFSDIENYWADPDIDVAAKLMLSLVNDPQLRENIGKKAKIHIQKVLDPIVIGSQIKSRLNYLYANTLPSLENDDKQIISDLRHQNTTLRTKLDILKKTKAVRWKLAFKNLKNKFSGKNKKYIWED